MTEMPTSAENNSFTYWFEPGPKDLDNILIQGVNGAAHVDFDILRDRGTGRPLGLRIFAPDLASRDAKAGGLTPTAWLYKSAGDFKSVSKRMHEFKRKGWDSETPLYTADQISGLLAAARAEGERAGKERLGQISRALSYPISTSIKPRGFDWHPMNDDRLSFLKELAESPLPIADPSPPPAACSPEAKELRDLADNLMAAIRWGERDGETAKRIYAASDGLRRAAAWFEEIDAKGFIPVPKDAPPAEDVEGAVLAEREACAALADKQNEAIKHLTRFQPVSFAQTGSYAATQCGVVAAAIRARTAPAKEER